MMNNTSAKQRRSLKGALRTILWKCRRQSPEDTNTIGSGILRREPSLPTLPNESTTAFLLGLDSDEYDERYDSDIPDRFDISSLATSAAMSSTRTLMPKMSLSDFHEYHPPIQETRYLQRGRCRSVASSLAEGASYQASLVSMNSYRSASTLRIQKSSHTLISESEQCDPPLCFPERIGFEDDPVSRPTSAFECPSPPQITHNFSPPRSLIRKRGSVGDLTSATPSTPLKPFEPPAIEMWEMGDMFQPYHPYGGRRFHQALSVIEEDVNSIDERRTLRSKSSIQFSETPQISRTPSLKSDVSNPLHSIKPFSSFCALDTVTSGWPVTATSKDLRYIFEIGEQFCLNNQGCEDISIDMITGSDAAGNPVTHLVLFNPLIIPSSGRSRFMLASLIDVTDFIHDAASLPELEMITEESVQSIESDPPTPRLKMQPSLRGPKYQLSAETLLGGCFLEEPHTPTMQRIDEDIWLNLATEERKQYSQPKIHNGTKSPASATSAISLIDEVLDDFVSRLQELHSDFFLLAKSPLDDNYYEICNVSPRVYASRDYVNGHLSHTSASDMMEMSGHLTGDEAFDMQVRWGTEGVLKHLYCIPLFARSAVTWICFLVDPGLPVLW